jgi:hypothetical protein
LSTPRIRYWEAALVAFAAVLAVAGLIAVRSLPRIARQLVIADLQQRFRSTIEIGQIQINGLIPVRIVAGDILLRYHGRNDVPPLMTIKRLTGAADLHGIWTGKWRVTSIHLEGLQIRIPPRAGDTGRSYVVPQSHAKLRLPPIEFREVTADDALLQILPRQSDHKPRSFGIQHVTLRSIKPGEPAHFHAQLTNEIPVGDIDSEGTFGPWNSDQPSLTPVTAKFEFTNANLGQFRGLSGTLSSTGQYGGVLERLDVEGDALVPDFSLSLSGRPVELKTHYVAVVDGTNGNTYLKSVDAHFLRSTLRVNGEVIDPPGSPSRRIVLTVTTSDARAEDLLTLVTKGNGSPIAGAVKLAAQFQLPSGKTDIVDRLALSAQFEITRADFANRQIQQKIDDLSRRGRGQPGNEAISDVTCNIRGSLHVREAETHFSTLDFAVPGASASLNGSYGLKTEVIDLHGMLRLTSKLSQTTTGAKSIWLRVLNPFFRDGSSGSVLPVKITGPRSNPAFGLDLRRHHKPGQTTRNPALSRAS